MLSYSLLFLLLLSSLLMFIFIIVKLNDGDVCSGGGGGDDGAMAVMVMVVKICACFPRKEQVISGMKVLLLLIINFLRENVGRNGTAIQTGSKT